MNTDTDVTIFTDGSSRGNPGPGGWGTVVIQSSKLKTQNLSHVTELGGREKETTNNRMEIMAAIKGLGSVDSRQSTVDSAVRITILTDSSYVINGITKWIKGWKRNGWLTKTKDDVLNKDLWMELDLAIVGRSVAWKYVGGHIGILGNERCDHIATAFADGQELKLYKGPLAGYDLPDILEISHDEEKATTKKSSSSHSRAKAYSYVSVILGVIEVHHSWPECEKRVKGAKGARYKKATSAEDEARIIAEFEAI